MQMHMRYYILVNWKTAHTHNAQTSCSRYAHPPKMYNTLFHFDANVAYRFFIQYIVGPYRQTFERELYAVTVKVFQVWFIGFGIGKREGNGSHHLDWSQASLVQSH